MVGLPLTLDRFGFLLNLSIYIFAKFYCDSNMPNDRFKPAWSNTSTLSL